MKLRAWLAACGSIYLIASIIREDCEVVSDLSGFKIMRDQNLELNDFSTGVLESKQISIKKTSLAEDEDSSLLVSACNFLHINWLTVLKKTLCILPFNAVRYTFNTVSILGSTGSQFNLGQNLFSGHAEFFFFFYLVDIATSTLHLKSWTFGSLLACIRAVPSETGRL